MKKKWKRVSALALSASMALSLAACGGSSGAAEGSGESGAESGAADSGAGAENTAAGAEGDANTLIYQLDNEVQTMDCQVATDGMSFQVQGMTTEGLFSPDQEGKPSPAMALSEDVSEDGLTRTFHLREDAKWSNGTPVTADDFVYAWQRAVDPEVGSEYAFLLGVAGVKNADAIANGEMPVEDLGVKAVDDHTFEVQLDTPVAFFDTMLFFPTFFPTNREFCEAAGDQYATTPDTMLANGPYKIASYEPAATTIELVKNPDYWDADAVKLDGIRCQVIKETQQALLAYQSGELDFARISGEQVEQYQSDPEFQAILTGFVWYLSPNLKAEGLENHNLRMALALAFDKDAVVNNVVKDGSVAANYFVPKGIATGPDGTDFRDDPDGTRTFLATDKAKAQEYFEKAKAELGKDTFDYTLLVEDSESAVNVAQFIQQEIQTTLPGVTIELQQLPKKERVARMQEGDYEIALTRWGPDYGDPMTYLSMFTSDSSNNYGGWSNADYDAIIESAQKGELATKPQERWEALKEAEKIALDDAVIFPVYQKCNASLIKSNVKGIWFNPVAVDIFKNVVKE